MTKMRFGVNYNVSLLERDVAERSHIIRELERLKARYAIRGRRIAELGCGLGQNLLVFADDNNVIGVDGLEEAAEAARAHGIEVIQADIEGELPFAPATFDWVFCLDVLEHLVDPFRLVLAVRTMLRPGGKLVVNVPNHLDIKGRLRLLAGSGLDVHNFFPHTNDWDNPHLRFFTHRGIREMLVRSGYTIVDDRSWAHSSIALLNRLADRGLSPIVGSLVRSAPSLLAGGFFLVAEH